ncbi:MAG: DUF5667 domain-containing protein [Patescibacteria group bacterium]|jgi:hypothetical protein
MKIIIISLIILLVPVSVLAEPMLRPVSDNTNEEVITVPETITNTNIANNDVTIVNVEIDLPDLKWVPSSPLYFLKTWWETARGWFMIDVVKKAEYRIMLANRRLEEIEVLAQKQKTEVIGETTDRFNEQMVKANTYIEKAKAKGKDLESIYRLLEENRVKHQITFGQISNSIPDEAKAIIEQAKKTSQDSFESTKNTIKAKAKNSVQQGIDLLQEQID